MEIGVFYSRIFHRIRLALAYTHVYAQNHRVSSNLTYDLYQDNYSQINYCFLRTKFSKRKMIKYDVGNYYLPSHYHLGNSGGGGGGGALQKASMSSIMAHNSKKSSFSTLATTIPSISMLEFDSTQQQQGHNHSHPLKSSSGSHQNVSGIGTTTKKQRTLSGSNSPSSLSATPIKYNKSKNGGSHHVLGGHKHKNSMASNSRSTSMTSSGSQAGHHLIKGKTKTLFFVF